MWAQLTWSRILTSTGQVSIQIKVPSSSLPTSLSLKSHPSSHKTLFLCCWWQPQPGRDTRTSPYPAAAPQHILQDKTVMLTHISVFPLLFLHLSASTLSSTVVSETISALLSLTTMCMTRPLLMWASKVLFQGGYMVGFFCTYTWPFSVEGEHKSTQWGQFIRPNTDTNLKKGNFPSWLHQFCWEDL